MSILDDLERMEREATAGPWVYVPVDEMYRNAPHMVWGPNGPGHGTVAQTCSPGLLPHPKGTQAIDAALIAAARNVLPALLRLARAAQNTSWMVGRYVDTNNDPEEAMAYEELTAALAALESEARS